MDKIIVLNLLFQKDPYSQKEIENIAHWIRLFNGYGIPVIATPPKERKDVFEKLTGLFDEELFVPCPVTSFDTCDRWRGGLETALTTIIRSREEASFYLWSADFHFDGQSKEAASELLFYDGDEDFVVGTITAKGRKEAIDEVATNPLLEHWFPEDYKKMKEKGITKPRSELLRLSYRFLKEALNRRWYPAEQTIYLILQCFWYNYPVKRLYLSEISDSDASREGPDVIQQVERMELWLKYIWRDRHNEWEKDEYINMGEKSFQITQAAVDKLLSNNRIR